MHCISRCRCLAPRVSPHSCVCVCVICSKGFHPQHDAKKSQHEIHHRPGTQTSLVSVIISLLLQTRINLANVFHSFLCLCSFFFSCGSLLFAFSSAILATLKTHTRAPRCETGVSPQCQVTQIGPGWTSSLEINDFITFVRFPGSLERRPAARTSTTQSAFRSRRTLPRPSGRSVPLISRPLV